MTSYLSQFNYQITQGQGAPSGHPHNWIFLHGLMGFGLNWRRIVTQLPSDHQSLTFDQRGHGKSFHPTSGFAPKDYAADVELIRQELQWNPIILVGHSMGARNALSYAHTYPQYLSHLILEDMGPEPSPEATPFYQHLLESIPTPFVNKLAAKTWLLNDFLKTPWGQQGGVTLAQYLYSNIAETARGTSDQDVSGHAPAADWRFSKTAMLETIALGRSQNQWEEWFSVKCPSLVIRGENSKDLASSTFTKMLQTNKNSRGVVIKKAGHWVHFDQPLIFVQNLLEFVNFDKGALPP